MILTVCLITVIFYNHPSTSNVTLFFRTVPILPETNGRVAEIFVGASGTVSKGDPIFRLDSSKQEAAIDAAKHKIAEIDAEIVVARTDVLKAEGEISRPRARTSKLWMSLKPSESCSGEIRETWRSAKSRGLRFAPRVNWARSTLPPPRNRAPKSASRRRTHAQRGSAEAALAQAQVDLDKTVIRAGVSGRVQQFLLRVGNVVNPLMRPAGVLIPEGAGQKFLQAGFDQIKRKSCGME